MVTQVCNRLCRAAQHCVQAKGSMSRLPEDVTFLLRIEMDSRGHALRVPQYQQVIDLLKVLLNMHVCSFDVQWLLVIRNTVSDCFPHMIKVHT